MKQLGSSEAESNVAEVTFEGQQLYGKFKRQPLKPVNPDKADKADKAEKDKQAAAAKTAPATEGKDPTNPAGLPKLLPVGEKPSGSTANDYYALDFSVFLPPTVDKDFTDLLVKRGVEIVSRRPQDNTALLVTFLYLVVPLLMFAGVWYMFRRARDQVMGGGLLSGFIKSPAQRYEANLQRITFDDVAGLEEAKSDLQEIVEYLKNPKKFERLGGRVPKGVLLVGPPGTGKTLLARAVAGEAGVPFFSINGSEFIQMFVGVGAGRVRDMFKTAKDASPAILFIDEIDAVGRHRGAGLGGGNDEREQTLNQILSEMDGFQRNESVIVLAATNRPDVLDPALLRPGRFDRHVTVDRPSQKGRAAIFRVHTRNIPLADDVDLDRLASGSVGLTGADIRNLVNEATLWATRHGKDRVENVDFEYARDKILMGAKREEVLSDKEKKMTAYHEAGHALIAWMLPGTDRVHKVTIIPRGRALGVTQLLPDEDRMNISESDLSSRLAFILGGRAAEKLIFHELTAGAENDLTQATKLARRMVAHWGMSERLGPVAYHISEEHPFLGRELHQQREFSEHTAQLIDEEVARLLHGAADRAVAMLEKHRDLLDKLATALIEREVLDDREIEQLIGPSANPRSNRNGAVTIADAKVPVLTPETQAKSGTE
ncbi:MAG: ATP-dependent zinc metalloprotease FtsH [Planctomycetia bacterium]|nr:ATP-dependent zinc metalloprotease FtsH [Planctomycetia bacterium]